MAQRGFFPIKLFLPSHFLYDNDFTRAVLLGFKLAINIFH